MKSLKMIKFVNINAKIFKKISLRRPMTFTNIIVLKPINI